MSRPKTDLSSFDNSDFDVGASKLKWALWFFANSLIVKNPINPFNGLKRAVLKAFGAKIGVGVVIKPGVNVKFPWRLEVGNHVWLGENVWIENHRLVSIADHCCVSQEAMLLCGNHNYKKTTFDLMASGITLEEGAWVGARSVVCPGITVKSHAILAVGSVASSDLEAYSIYKGNPAVKVRDRNMEA